MRVPFALRGEAPSDAFCPRREADWLLRLLPTLVSARLSLSAAASSSSSFSPLVSFFLWGLATIFSELDDDDDGYNRRLSLWPAD